MILKGNNSTDSKISLISYCDEIDNQALKLKYLEWLNDVEVVSPILSEVLMKPNKGLAVIDESFERFTKADSLGFFIKYVPTNYYIGTIKLDKISQKNASGELGIMIGEKKMWGKGFGLSACLILLRYAFEDLELNRVWGGTDENNEKMQKLFLKAGFKEEGRLREANYFNGNYTDSFRYSILKKEWDKMQ